MPLAEKGDLLVDATKADDRARRRRRDGQLRRLGHHEVAHLVSEGHRIDQRIRECGAAMEANVNGEAETQRRSYPGIRGQFGTRGWELVRELDLLANAPRIAEEARELLTAPLCPSLDATDLIIGSRADGVADPRVGRPRRGARPHPGLGGGLRGHVVAGPASSSARCGSAAT